MMDWLSQLEWERLVPELIGKAAGFFVGFAASWFLLFRKRLKAIERMRAGDSDDLLFQAHYLVQQPDDSVLLIFRSVAERRTIETAYDNPAARDELRRLADSTTLRAPVLPTRGKVGFEILNDAAGLVCGSLATSPMERQSWLFCMTCEDRSVVRKKCIRCFLIRAEDLIRFNDWSWCRETIRVERPWHWFRVVALHRISRLYRDEQLMFSDPQPGDAMPLVDDQLKHRRIIPLALGIIPEDLPVAEPLTIQWDQIKGLQQWFD